jgi:hypothetical protein
MPHTKYFDLTGQRFAKLFVIERFSPVGKKPVKWKCLCDCGNETTVDSANLRNKSTSSCGCKRRLDSSKRAKTHGLTKTQTYRIWGGMRTRCLNPKSSNYSLYGGRGIKCCERWNSFENFLADMGERPKGMTLDRIDVDGNYEPNNCRWASNKEQAQNRRKCRLINKDKLFNFLITQDYLSKNQAEKIVENFFKENQ